MINSPLDLYKFIVEDSNSVDPKCTTNFGATLKGIIVPLLPQVIDRLSQLTDPSNFPEGLSQNYYLLSEYIAELLDQSYDPELDQVYKEVRNLHMPSLKLSKERSESSAKVDAETKGIGIVRNASQADSSRSFSSITLNDSITFFLPSGSITTRLRMKQIGTQEAQAILGQLPVSLISEGVLRLFEPDFGTIYQQVPVESINRLLIK